MNYTTGFFQKDLNVYYKLYNTIDRELSKNDNSVNYKFDDNLYRLFCIFKGECVVRTDKGKETVKENTVVLISPEEKYKYKFDYKTTFEYLFVDIHPNTFKNIDDKDFYRPFSTLNKSEKNINFTKYPILKAMLDGLAYSCTHSGSRCHIEPRVQAIFSELCAICDIIHPQTTVANESLPVRLVYYVKTHYTENITYELLKDKFFVSAPTINTIIKNFAGVTLNEFITNLRLNNALNMINDGFIDSTAKISDLSGFNNYSTFYRAFKKKYGISPSELKKIDKTSWPLSK